MRISDWSSDVCSSDLVRARLSNDGVMAVLMRRDSMTLSAALLDVDDRGGELGVVETEVRAVVGQQLVVRALLHDAALLHHEDHVGAADRGKAVGDDEAGARSEEHTSELQSLMRSSYAVFCL